jgi:hypothetical protein
VSVRLERELARERKRRKAAEAHARRLAAMLARVVREGLKFEAKEAARGRLR